MRIYKRVWVFLVFLIILVNYNTYGQTESGSKKKDIIINNGRPDIPGELGFDLGLVVAPDFPDSMKLKLVHCTYFSPYYKFETFIPNTKFSIVTGLSLGLEKYRFKDPVTITRSLNDNGKFNDQIVSLDTVLFNVGFKGSKLAVNYLEIPLEIRYRTNKTYPKNSFFVSIGGKIGYMFNSHTKYKYKQEGQIKTSKFRSKFDLNSFRYGFEGRMGFGNFNLFYYQSLNTLFQKDKGPAGNMSEPKLVGLSLTLF